MSALDWAGWLLVSLVTFLGDPLTIVALGLGVYWVGDRVPGIGDRLEPERGALLLATILGGLALSATLKTGFGLARPAGAADLPGLAGMPDALVPVYTWIVGPGGHAFPSGHATAATAGWLGLAWALGAERRTLLPAAGLVAAVAASRVALGVHRPHEVLVGIGVGLTLLLVVFELLERPGRAFALAGVIGVVGPLVVGLSGDSLLAASVALGAAVGAAGVTRGGTGWLSTGLPTAAVVVVTATTFLRFGGVEVLLAIVGIVGGAVVVTLRRSRLGIETR